MDIKKLAVCLLILSASLSILCIPSTFAATAGHWITSYTVEDATTGQKLIQADFATSDQPTVISPVISGEQLKVTFTVDIFTSGTGSLKLGTSMQKPNGAIWELVPGGDYDLGAGFTPNSLVASAMTLAVSVNDFGSGLPRRGDSTLALGSWSINPSRT